MKILLDHCVPAGLRKHLTSHEAVTARRMGWEELRNGKLLQVAQAEFDVLLSTDGNIEYQQSLPNYDIALVVLRAEQNKLSVLLELIPALLQLLPTVQPGEVSNLFTAKLRAIEERRQQRPI